MKPTLLIPIFEQTRDIVEVLNSITVENWDQVILLYDSSGYDFVEGISSAYPKLAGIYNTKAPIGFSRLVNLGIKQAANSVFILNQHAIIPAAWSIDDVPQGLTDYFDTKGLSPLDATFIHKDVIDKIGYLDEAFLNGSEDYRIRAMLAGIPTGVLVKPAPIKIDSIAITDFELMKLCWKYSEKGLTLDQLHSKIKQRIKN